MIIGTPFDPRLLKPRPTDIELVIEVADWSLSIDRGSGQPEPDGAVACGSIDDYSATHPRAENLAMVIEVSDSTLDRDRQVKLPSYASAGIVCYWIVNLIDRQIEVYTQPIAAAEVPTYATSAIFKPGDSLPFKIGGQLIAEIPVADILPV